MLCDAGTRFSRTVQPEGNGDELNDRVLLPPRSSTNVLCVWRQIYGFRFIPFIPFFMLLPVSWCFSSSFALVELLCDAATIFSRTVQPDSDGQECPESRGLEVESLGKVAFQEDVMCGGDFRDVVERVFFSEYNEC